MLGVTQNIAASQQILLDGQPGKNLAAFRHLHDSLLDDAVRHPPQFLPLEFYTALLLFHQTGNRVEQRRFACPVRTNDTDDTSLRYLDRHTGQGLDMTIGNMQILYSKHASSSSPM